VDADGPAGSVHGPVDEHAFELDLQVADHTHWGGGDVPLQGMSVVGSVKFFIPLRESARKGSLETNSPQRQTPEPP
jgi:hypothetical protein